MLIRIPALSLSPFQLSLTAAARHLGDPFLCGWSGRLRPRSHRTCQARCASSRARFCAAGRHLAGGKQQGFGFATQAVLREDLWRNAEGRIGSGTWAAQRK
ncbi:hypothetical protein BU26DRAFT_79847 [Trematosphaeria pertusa]|uniref:Uncharacterized protein n=1 Tax=Trematosphaeria pertusa TaxID=390896 RepID=A0A6A6I3G8_9PLEO|nr:uncharacterized protein BU26DRAFT_79847 [Trematosphaeria pertusa]KAF2244538.1 hypothetical protein BU26DRAFT_79847 [Trematosphaeria pertusa]